MRFCVLASGSKGNLTYVEYENTAILVDAGISYQNALKRTMEQNIDLRKVKHIFITHEHGDHVGYLASIQSKISALVYIHKDSYQQLKADQKNKLKKENIRFIEEDSKYHIGDLEVYTLKMSHDAACCLGFIFSGGMKKLGYVVDTGFFPIRYIAALKTLDSIIIEANHDVEMLTESKRQWMLKERILSPTGHMSNYICAQVLQSIVHNKMQAIVLAHLSEDCNTEELVKQDIVDIISKQFYGEIFIAKQKEALKMIELR